LYRFRVRIHVHFWVAFPFAKATFGYGVESTVIR